MKDYYQILGLPNYSKHNQIAKWHIDLTNVFISDRHQGEHITATFELQTEAYYLLKNSKRKARYDKLHALKFRKKSKNLNKTGLKWEKETEEDIKVASESAKELAQLTNAELSDRNSNLEKHSKFGLARNITGGILEFLHFFISI